MAQNVIEFEVHVRDTAWETGSSFPEDWTEYTWARNAGEAMMMVENRLPRFVRAQYANPVDN